MLALSLYALLLAALPAPGAQLHLQPLNAGQAEAHLCVQGSGQLIRYQLRVVGHGPAGRSQSLQNGEIRATPEPVCPSRNRVGATPSTRVEAQLRWWVDGVEQVPLGKVLELR